MATTTKRNGVSDPAFDLEQPPEQAGKKASSKDPELLAMGRLDRILGTLPEPAKGRVVRWLSDRYADQKGGA